MTLSRPAAVAAALLALSATLAAGQVRPVQPVQPVRPVATPVAPVRPVSTPAPSWAPQRPAATQPVARPVPPSWGQQPARPATTPAATPAAEPAPAPAPQAADAAPAAPSDAAPAASNGWSRTSYPAKKGDTPQELVDAPRFDLVSTRRFDSAKDYAACLELQKQTGLCILLYFANLNDVSQKGLCHWWEKKLQNSREWQRAAKNYLCVTITLPGNAEDRALAEKMRVKTTPAVFVVQPNDNWPKRVNVISWSDQKEPQPATPAEGLQMLHDASTPAYQAILAPLMR